MGKKKKAEIEIDENGVNKSSVDFLRQSLRASDENIIDLSDDMFSKDFGKIPTGLPDLDNILHGGIPIGKLTEIFGWEGSGKSAILDSLATEIIAQDGFVFFHEPERAHEKNRIRSKLLRLPNVIKKMPNGQELTIEEWEYLRSEEQMKEEEQGKPVSAEEKLFDPVDLILWSGADTIEKIIAEHISTLETIGKMKDRDFPCAIFLDSVASCGSVKEEEAEVGEQQFSPHAMVISKALRNKIIASAAKYKVAIVWLNQLREKMSTGGRFAKFVGPRKTSDEYNTFGGNAIKFYASLRLNVSAAGKYQVEHSKTDREIVGQWSEVEIIKSKVWGVRPWQKCKYLIGYDGGTDSAWGLYDYLTANDFIKPAGIHGSKVIGLEDKYFKKNEWAQFFKENRKAIESLVYEEEPSVE